MSWLLILIMTTGPQTARVDAGLLATEQLCMIAGHSMARALAAANPGLTVGFRCLPGVAA